MNDFNPLKCQSTKSIQSAKFGKHDHHQGIAAPVELDQFIHLACQKFCCPCKFAVKREVQTGEYTQMFENAHSASRIKKVALVLPSKVLHPEPATPETGASANQETSQHVIEESDLTIRALYNTYNRLAEVVLQNENVPSILIKFFAIILPLQPLLSKLTFKKCQINAYSIYEISKFLPMTSITDICLDDTLIPEANYALLLQKSSKLVSLSLARCNINDEVCEQIASHLHFTEPAEAKLSTLNLTSNHVTNKGAKHLGEALRTNRHLRYLNLAGNRISDKGADHIFNTLIDFPLTSDEIARQRDNHLAYLKARLVNMTHEYNAQQSITKSVDDLTDGKPKKPQRSSSVKTKRSREKKSIASTEDIQNFESDAADVLMPSVDPFGHDFINTVDGHSWCVGNMSLSYLNLSYNNLSYFSLKKLVAVLDYQSNHRKPYETGLLRVVVDGNPMPSGCSELKHVQEILSSNVISLYPKQVKNLTKGKTSRSASEKK